MIVSFADEETRRVFEGGPSRRLPAGIRRRAWRLLGLIDSAEVLNDLRSPPGNRLEALRGDRAGQHSVRIHDQWRVCFVCREGRVYDVQIVDYHR